MKKSILTLLVVLLTAGVFAQSTTPATDKQMDMKDLRKDIRDKRHDNRIRAHELKEGHKNAAMAETKDIKADNKNIAGDTKDLKNDGVKHPVKRAQRQIHRQNVRHKHQG